MKLEKKGAVFRVSGGEDKFSSSAPESRGAVREGGWCIWDRQCYTSSSGEVKNIKKDAKLLPVVDSGHL